MLELHVKGVIQYILFVHAFFHLGCFWNLFLSLYVYQWFLCYWELFHCMHTYVLSRFSHVRLFVTLWTVAHQAPLTMGFSRQEYWSGLPWPSPEDLSDPGIEPMSFMSPVLAGGLFITSTNWEACFFHLEMFECDKEMLLNHLKLSSIPLPPALWL